MNPTHVIDQWGLYGTMLHYTLVIAIVGSAFLIFFVLWIKGRLDMDEEPKWQMMQEERPEQENDHD